MGVIILSIISEIEDKFSDEIDIRLAEDEAYQKAIKDLFCFLKENVSDDKEEQYNDLVGRLTSSLMRISFSVGMKIGARLEAELLK